ncbi:YfhO family protein [Paenibacillus sp. NPDC058071]|uniref:YfhO family protein n=1 Tax=Paenibacillus sp. NPDC058071 TaxID=3346326 RepID=UPI0036DF69B7
MKKRTIGHRIEKMLESTRYPIPVMILVVICMYYKVIIGKLWMKWDMYGGIFPSFVSVSSHLKDGALPLWEPFVHRGIPISHLLGAPIWYPTTILFGLIGQTQYLLQLQFFLIILSAAIFMYLACTLYVNNRWLCAIGGIAYSSCGLFVANAEHITFIITASLFPLLHYSIKKMVENQSSKFFSILFGTTVALLVLNSYPPFVIFCLFYIVFELIVSYKKINKLALIKQMILAIIVAVAGSFVTLVTTVQVMSEITRSKVPWDIATNTSLNIWNWFASLTPAIAQLAKSLNPPMDISMNNTYIALPLLMGAFLIGSFERNKKVLYVFLFFSILLCMGRYAPVYQFFYHFVPGIDTFKFPAGLRYFYFYFLTIIALRNIQFVMESKESNWNEQYAKIVKVFIGIFVVILLSISSMMIKPMEPMQPTEWMIKYFGEEIVVTIIILFLFLIAINKKSKVVFISSFIVLTIVFSVLGVYRNQVFTIGTEERPFSYNEAIDALYKGENNTIANEYAENSTILESDSIFYQRFNTGGYVGSFDLKNFEVAFVNQMLPNVGEPAVWATETELYDNGVKKILPTNIQWFKNKFVVDVQSDTSQSLVFEQTYFPGWRAEVNGEKVDVRQFSAAGLIAVPINAGDNNVVLEYKPMLVIISAYVTFTAWLVLFVYFIVTFVRRFKGNAIK